MPSRRFPSGVWIARRSAPGGRGPARGTASIGKMSEAWKSNIRKSSPRGSGYGLACEGRLDSRSNPIDRVGLLDHWGIVELGRRRVDVTAGGDDERNVLLAEPGGDGPHILAFEVDVEDGEIEPALLDLVERALDRVAGPANLVTQRIEKILKHHGDERLVLDDQNGARIRHIRSG